jgi:biotin-[acetyl-CoA-carboxylase] ligase BirA-like protein
MTSYTLLEFDELQSTSDFLKENHSYFPHMTMIRAGYQTKGRGQFDRVWLSNPGENVLFSILLKNISTNQSHQLKAWIMFGLISYFQTFGITPEFKEPNDLYVGDQKLAGILIESLSLEDMFDVVVVGIGININQSHFPNFPATSLSLLTGQSYDIRKIFKELADRFMHTYPNYIK